MEINQRIREEARKAIYDTGRGMIGRERNYLEDRVCRALLAAEKRGREEAAKIADAHAECERDCGDVIAAAIRSTN